MRLAARPSFPTGSGGRPCGAGGVGRGESFLGQGRLDWRARRRGKGHPDMFDESLPFAQPGGVYPPRSQEQRF